MKYLMKLIYGLKKQFKIIFIIFLLLCNIFYFNLYSLEIKNFELSYLKEGDKKKFILKCSKDNIIIKSPDCYNFIGIKIYLKAYLNKDMDKEAANHLKKKAIAFLNLSKELGSKKALKNLAWIYSSSLNDIEQKKSSDLFKELNKEILINNLNTKEDINVKKKPKEYDFDNLEIALVLRDNLEVYFESGRNRTFNYISKEELNYANRILEKIIIQSNISKIRLEKLIEKVKNKNDIILSFLKEELEVFSDKNEVEAKRILKKLENLLAN